MERWDRRATWATAAVAGVLVSIARIHPGAASGVVLIGILTSIIWVPALALVEFLLSLRLRRKRGSRAYPDDFDTYIEAAARIHRRRFRRAAAVVLAISIALTALDAPRRLAFLAAHSAFEELIASAATSSRGGESLNRRLGIYHVDEYAADPRGGVYFRTAAGHDGMGPDVLSHGFAWRPNQEGSPYGRARYGLSHVFGDWYAFTASDDY